MQAPHHLVVLEGPDKGLRIALPPGGARLGRASQNEVVLADPLLSRHHCRMTFHPGDGLWVADLASANQTIVNGQPLSESRLRPGDRVLIGDTLLQVLDDTPPETAAPAGAATAGAPAETTATPLPPEAQPVVDLGFEAQRDPETRRTSLRPLLWTVGAAALLVLGGALILRQSDRMAEAPPRAADDADRARRLTLHYEKVEADRGNVFRYEMTLDANQQLAIRIDDLAQDRHVRREGIVATNLVRELAREIESSGFFALNPSYEGIPQEGVLASWELTVTLDRRAHRCGVLNRLEPEIFRNLRERLETFGKNELGIWAVQFSRDKLLALASDALTRGRNKLSERDIAYGNLADAIRLHQEADFYLETVEPKPDFYADIVSGLRQARDDLDARFEEQRFRADRAINLQDWATAARELRVLMELIPDRNDTRHADASRKLLDVENRLNKRK